MTPRLRYYCRDRLFEWAMTLAMLGLAVEIYIWPDTVGASAFRLMLGIVTAGHMGVFFLVFGVLRIVALVANGRWPLYGPQLRTAGAGASAFMWGQMCAALLMLAPLKGVPSPGIPIYLALTLGELISAYRAMSDARSADR
jgi:hypothetical protein